MSDPVLIAIIVGVSTCIQSAIATLNHNDAVKRSEKVEAKVDETHKSINGRMDQLVAASNAQGRQEQRAETRQDAKDAAL
jgi:hypothetical protein